MLLGAAFLVSCSSSTDEGPPDIEPTIARVKLTFAKAVTGELVDVFLESGQEGTVTLPLTAPAGSSSVYAFFLDSDGNWITGITDNHFRVEVVAPDGGGITIQQNSTNLQGAVLRIFAPVTSVPVTFRLLHTSKANHVDFGPVTVRVTAP
jgi:hypothetical protein